MEEMQIDHQQKSSSSSEPTFYLSLGDEVQPPANDVTVTEEEQIFEEISQALLAEKR
jgi:hypothetical protein